MNAFVTAFSHIDEAILQTLNSLAAEHRSLWEFANNSLFRGLPLLFSIPALWFSTDDLERRSRMLVGLLAVCFATLLSVWSQFHFAVHIRPILDPGLHLQNVIEAWTWDRTSSFPSDTATLYFGLAAVILLEKRLVGLFCFVWVMAVIAIPRVIFGLHYASDIIGALVLGPAFVFIFAKGPYPRRLLEHAFMHLKAHMYVVDAFLVVLLTELFDTFMSLQSLAKQLVRLLHS